MPLEIVTCDVERRHLGVRALPTSEVSVQAGVPSGTPWAIVLSRGATRIYAVVMHDALRPVPIVDGAVLAGALCTGGWRGGTLSLFAPDGTQAVRVRPYAAPLATVSRHRDIPLGSATLLVID